MVWLWPKRYSVEYVSYNVLKQTITSSVNIYNYTTFQINVVLNDINIGFKRYNLGINGIKYII